MRESKPHSNMADLEKRKVKDVLRVSSLSY